MRIIKGELKGGGISQSVSLLNSCESSITSVMSSLDTFISDSTLNSTAYNKIRSLLEEYKSILLTDKQIANDLASSIDSTTSNMAAFMGEFDEIDDGKKEGLSNSILSLRNSIAEYNASVNALSKEEDADKIRIINQNKANALDSLDYYNRLLDKINSLASQDSGQYGQLASVSGSLKNLTSTFGGMGSFSISDK